ncbi:BQ2448_586 [Microbotryum intermedium]|uniref:BQ2448_586 protein n=1 Tax=Microbotryum intermedium TaxID=269621 RepID=A0A238F5Q2_9BASI|nr:BQ2448_586 [Microbotryum intermedium]
MAVLSSRQRALYRFAWRRFGQLLPLVRYERRNLRAVYRPQFRELIQDDQVEWAAVEHKVHATLKLLQASPSLLHQLPSLYYHHHYIQAQADSHQAIKWNPQDPASASKLWATRHKKAQRAADGLAETVQRGVAKALQGLVEHAEKAERVMLGLNRVR